MIWVLVGVCLLVSFVFSGIEAGILSVNRVRLRHRVKLRDAAAIRLSRLLSAPDRLLVSVLVVTNLMNIFAITLVVREFEQAMGVWGYAAALAVFLPIHLLGLEMLPKSIFRRIPYSALAALSGPLRLADWLLGPLHFIGAGVNRLLARHRTAEAKKLFAAREEFKYLTIESERTGALTKAERQMIHNVVDFRGITAADVMVPMSEVRCIRGDASIGELLELSRKHQIDRWPVTSSLGEIVGLVSVFDIALEGRTRGKVESFQRRIVKLSPQETAYTILRKMRASRSTVAAVLGPGARPLGLVTWEDLIKRLVSPSSGEAP
jgi:putative hemolysin